MAVTGTPPFNGTLLDPGFVVAGKQYGSDVVARVARCTSTAAGHT